MRCRLCGCQDTPLVLDLGLMPLANAFLDSPGAPEKKYPLRLCFCPDCSLLQITETVSPSELFSHYNYFSSISQSMLSHAKELTCKLIETRHLNAESRIIELASNDGYMLRYFQQAGVPNVLGIDPAENVVEVARSNGVPTLCEFFGEKIADTIEPADVVIGLNVLGHVADINGFVTGVRKILKPDGVAVFEVPYMRETVEGCQLDQLYFEHIFYYSLTAVKNLMLRNQLQILSAERIDIHGGGLRLWVGHPRESYSRPTRDMLEREKQLGVDRMEFYRDFAARVNTTLEDIRRVLVEQHGLGKRIVGFGAAAKGVMMLNALGAGIELIDRVVDETPAKQGKYTPGTHIKIVPPEEMGQVDVAFLLAWNWQQEFRRKFPQLEGKWLIPLPKPHFV